MDTVELPEMPAEQDLIALDDALTQLAKDRPEIAQLVNLRYFAGLSMEETARAMDTSLRTAERNWTFARAWLLEAIRDNS
jgi:DNA-directed RNA polymerase specialized sigma24 family protein